MHPDSTLAYRLGTLEHQLQNHLNNGDYSPEFTIYDTFQNHQIHEKSSLKQLALLQAEIDTIQYILTEDTTHLPTDWNWLQNTPEDTLSAVSKATQNAAHGGESTTWIAYLHRWTTTLQDILDSDRYS